MKTVWLVGNGKPVEGGEDSSFILQFHGVYESYDLALAACMEDSDFIVEAEMNTTIDFENLDYYFPYKKDNGGDLPA